MLKIIWNKEDIEVIKQKLKDDYQIVLMTDPNELPNNKIGLVVDEKHMDALKAVLDIVSLKKSQVLLQTHHGWIQVHVSKMTYLESFGEDIYLHLEDQPTEIVKQPLYQLEEQLKPYHFVRIGKSFIVNMTKIRYIRTGFNAKLDLELITGDHLEVSRSFVKSFKNALGILKED